MDAWSRREARSDRRFALIACVLANIHRSPDDDPIDIREFMPMSDEERRKFDAEKAKASQQRFAAAVGANRKDDRG